MIVLIRGLKPTAKFIRPLRGVENIGGWENAGGVENIGGWENAGGVENIGGWENAGGVENIGGWENDSGGEFDVKGLTQIIG